MKYQICKRCVMDTTDPEITFDSQGICNHCRHYENILRHLHTRAELEKEIEKIKKSGKGEKYDCIIGLSGGIDSSYVAYWIKRLGLRPLAVHVDNGWNTELSVNNIENIVRRLGIDFETIVIDWEEFKDLQLSFMKASEANVEIPTDHAIVASLYLVAVKHNVKYIIHGGNIISEAIMPRAWGYDARDLKHIKAVHKEFGKIPLKTFPTLGIWKLAYYVLIKKIKYFPILDYLDYNKKEAKEMLKKELHWRDYGKKHEESIFTKFFQNYILPKKFNIDKRIAHFSTLINAGQMTREEAIEELRFPPHKDAEEMGSDKNYVIKKFGISEDEFERIMALPVKTYKDYPNHSLFMERLVFVYRFIKKIIS